LTWQPIPAGLHAGSGEIVAEQLLDASTATGRLMLVVIGAVGQAERATMLERQREGIAKAQLEGRYKGHCAVTSPQPVGVWPFCDPPIQRDAPTARSREPQVQIGGTQPTIRPFERVDIGHCKLDPFP
jgi:DNA invertase Pin-like site-specific DNA recombinase